MNTNTLPRPTRRPRRALLELTPAGLDTATMSANRAMTRAEALHEGLAGDAQEGGRPSRAAYALAATRYAQAWNLQTACQKLNTPDPA